MSKLVILDMDGFLVYKKFISDTRDIKTSHEDGIITLKAFDVTVRNYCVKFVEELLMSYEVAIWTSMQWYNVEEILKHLFGKKYKTKFAFIWNRDQVLLDPDYGNESPHFIIYTRRPETEEEVLEKKRAFQQRLI